MTTAVNAATSVASADFASTMIAATPLTEKIRLIPLYYDNADSEASARELILSVRPDWGDDDGPIEFVRFTDGITNTVRCIAPILMANWDHGALTDLLRSTAPESGKATGECDGRAARPRGHTAEGIWKRDRCPHRSRS